jgi:hypothetical protein
MVQKPELLYGAVLLATAELNFAKVEQCKLSAYRSRRAAASAG